MDGSGAAFVPFEMAEVEQSIPARFAQQVRRHPDRVAVEGTAARLTYAQLDRRASALARAIVERAGEGEVPVALLMGLGPDAVTAILAVLQAGRCYVALDPAWPDSRTREVLADAGPALIVADAHLCERARALAAGAEVLTVDAAGATATALPRVAPGAPALLLYTSGSTGGPKGVLHSHRNVLLEVQTYTNDARVVPADRLTLWHSCSAANSVRNFYTSLCNGAALCTFDVASEGSGALARWIGERRITIVHTVATTYRRLLETVTDDGDLATVRLLRIGGEPISGEDVRRFRRHFPAGCQILHSMGPTESFAACRMFLVPGAHEDGGRVPVGYPAPGKSVLLWDEDDHEVAAGEIGEIVVRSQYLALGYWRQPELTAAVFLPDPAGGPERLYRTGDLGRLDAEGRLHHVGRRDFQVKIRGSRVEVTEVEGVLRELDGVAAVAVDVRAIEGGAPRLIAWVVPRPGQAPTASALRRGVAHRLPASMLPSAIVFLDSLPLLSTGKVDRRALPEPGRERPLLDVAYAAPRTPIERRLARLWAEQLRLDEVGIHDEFLDLGGNSLLAGRLIARVLDGFAVHVPAQALLASTTVAAMAELILRTCLEQAGPAAAAELLREAEAQPPAGPS
jgi:amino acid adenylation domain-containing protein